MNFQLVGTTSISSEHLEQLHYYGTATGTATSPRRVPLFQEGEGP